MDISLLQPQEQLSHTHSKARGCWRAPQKPNFNEPKPSARHGPRQHAPNPRLFTERNKAQARGAAGFFHLAPPAPSVASSLPLPPPDPPSPQNPAGSEPQQPLPAPPPRSITVPAPLPARPPSPRRCWSWSWKGTVARSGCSPPPGPPRPQEVPAAPAMTAPPPPPRRTEPRGSRPPLINARGRGLREKRGAHWAVVRAGGSAPSRVASESALPAARCTR